MLNVALAPLQPMFILMDVVSVVINIIKALATLDIKTIGEEIKKLPAAAAALAAILPILAIPLMLIGILDAIILFLSGFSSYLTKISTQLDAIAEAETYQDTLGASALIDAVICSKGQLDQFMEAASQGMTPINAMINAINVMLEVIGLGKFKIPSLTDVTVDNIGPTQEILSETAAFLQVIRSAIPI